MPIQQCYDENGKSGWQFNNGHCHTGRNARKNAQKDKDEYGEASLIEQAAKIISEQAQKEENKVQPL